MSFTLPRRFIVTGACAAALAAAPAAVWASHNASPRTVADPCTGGGININLVQEGVPIGCGPAQAPPVTSGGAPTQQTLTACSGIPGCLSNVLYGPGNVQVPQRDTTVHQSQ